MAGSVWVPTAVSATPASAKSRRPAAIVRVTHWLTALCFLALLVSGIEILLSHPRFYWGEAGNVLTPPLFKLPLPSSRSSVPTGFGYVLPDQNGWSRSLHFQAAWAVVFTGALYFVFGFFSGHYRRNLFPARRDLSASALWSVIQHHLHFKPDAAGGSYNLLQRLTYLAVIFALFPLIIWTGLAMSPAIAAAFPFAVILLGGQQSARTIHFFASALLLLFLLVHVFMVCISGFQNRMRAMITGVPLAESFSDKEKRA